MTYAMSKPLWATCRNAPDRFSAEWGARRVRGSFPGKDPQAVLNVLQAVLGLSGTRCWGE